jgi:NAD+ kinase
VSHTVALVVHHEREAAHELARDAAAWLEEAGHKVVLSDVDAAASDLEHLGVGPTLTGRPLDLAVSLGGDGTMLRAIEQVAGGGVPVLGVNVGLLGYLTEVEPEHLTTALGRFFAGDYRLEARMMLAVRVESVVGGTYRALNEAVIEKREAGHTVRLAVSLEGIHFHTYAADGLIVATPTGSTAYSLSARGPIVSPTHRCLLLTPVSPHTLFDRPLVLNPTEEVGIEVLGFREAQLSMDGRPAVTLVPGDRVHCVAADEVARLVRFRRADFHHILKRKFGLDNR